MQVFLEAILSNSKEDSAKLFKGAGDIWLVEGSGSWSSESHREECYGMHNRWHQLFATHQQVLKLNTP